MVWSYGRETKVLQAITFICTYTLQVRQSNPHYTKLQAFLL